MTRDLATWPDYSPEEIAAVRRILQSGKVNYWTGDEVRLFEQEYADYCGTKYGIALANGSVALELALEAAGIGHGDDVVVSPRSYIASASCVIRVGARPIFADVDRDSQNITAGTIADVLTPRTKAIIAVHHAGWPCDMDGIMELAASRKLLVVEDCAQAHGATYNGHPVGGIGHIGAFSFCQDKIITTGGEGGMLVLNDKDIWEKAWAIKDHGKSYDAVFNRDHPPGFRWLHESIGTNWRMTEMQAAIGRIQLNSLPAWTKLRSEKARAIASTIRKYSGIRLPDVPDNVGHAYYRLYAFLRKDGLQDGTTRIDILDALGQRGIPVFVGGCPEIYREKSFQDRDLAPKNALPVAAELGGTSLAFLVHPTLTASDVRLVCRALDDVFAYASRTIS